MNRDANILSLDPLSVFFLRFFITSYPFIHHWQIRLEICSFIWHYVTVTETKPSLEKPSRNDPSLWVYKSYFNSEVLYVFKCEILDDFLRLCTTWTVLSKKTFWRKIEKLIIFMIPKLISTCVENNLHTKLVS